MTRQFFTADDVYRLSREQGSSALVLGADDVITPEAVEQAERLGLRVVRAAPSKIPLAAAPEE